MIKLGETPTITILYKSDVHIYAVGENKGNFKDSTQCSGEKHPFISSEKV